MTLGLWDIDAGAPLPEHSHPHKQVPHLLKGKFEIAIDGSTQVMNGGMVAIISSNAKHSGKAINSCRSLDAFLSSL
jgi:quercetin dioxygenase-like cupin family protein